MIQPRLPVISMKIGTDKPVVGATLVVARSRRQPVFIPLCGLRKAMVIPSAARNLKSMITRPDSQCHAYIVTKSENSVVPIRHDYAIIIQKQRAYRNRPRHSGEEPAPYPDTGQESRKFSQPEYGGIGTNWYKNAVCWLYVVIDTSDSSTPLRCAQNDSD